MNNIVIEDFIIPIECDKLIKSTLAKESVVSDDGTYSLFNDAEVITRLTSNIKLYLPNTINDRDGQWTFQSINDVVKINKYSPTQYGKLRRFPPTVSIDGSKSFYSMLIFLNDGFINGETYFIGGKKSFNLGTCVAFPQDTLYASYKPLGKAKYVMKCEVMYKIAK